MVIHDLFICSLDAANKPPPLSNAGVKFREAPVQWLRGLNLRSTRMAIGVYSESHILQLVFLILIFLDVTAVMGELLLYNVCTYTDVSRLHTYHALLCLDR